jgi:hypothetical protein
MEDQVTTHCMMQHWLRQQTDYGMWMRTQTESLNVVFAGPTIIVKGRLGTHED